MKHLIILNQKAGKEKDVSAFRQEIEEAFKGLDYEIYFTEGPRKVIGYLRDYFKKNPDEQTRVYACGGDGAIHDTLLQEIVDFLISHRDDFNTCDQIKVYYDNGQAQITML